MGTTVKLIGPGGPVPGPDAFAFVAAQVEIVFAREDRRLSRFRPESELSEVNARAGRWTTVSMPFAELLRLSLRSAAKTGGLFDPTVLPALVAAGYDRDYDALRAEAAVLLPPPPPGGRWSEVEVDGDRVRIPRGVAIDFGGIGKGWTVDRACRVTSLLPWAVVDAGGDLRLRGGSPDGAVEIAIDDPEVPGEEMMRLRLEEGALATSSTTSRRWGPGLHQIIDPRTSRPARTTVVQATVWARTCARAEVLATWALLGGPSVLDHVPGALVLETGEVMVNLQRDSELEVNGVEEES